MEGVAESKKEIEKEKEKKKKKEGSFPVLLRFLIISIELLCLFV